MPPTLPTTPSATKLPGNAWWLLKVSLLLGLLYFGYLARLAGSPPQANKQPTAPPSARAIPSGWRP